MQIHDVLVQYQQPLVVRRGFL